MASPLPRVRSSRSYEFRAAEAAVAAAAGPETAKAPLPPLPRRPMPKGPVLSVLEARRPDMVRAITLLWGHPEMDQYFERLWLSDGSQAPIDPETMSDLMLLAQVHRAVLPRRPQQTLATIYGGDRVHAGAGDVWGDVAPRR